MIENFDDILPTQRSTSPAPASNGPQNDTTPVSIRSFDIQSDTRNERRMRRAERRPFIPEETTAKQKRSSLLYWATGIVTTALLLIVVGLFFFVHTTVVVTPYSESVVLSNNATFSAYAQPEGGELGFTTFTASSEKSTNLTATETTYVERYASGVITVLNNYDNNPQRLIKNTRFENTGGKIYRVRNSITVPGKTSAGPGSIDVTVYADVAGEASNMESGTFTIPGLAGDARFEAFSARIKTPITGGFSGNEPTVDQAELERTRTTLRNELQTALLEQARASATTDTTVFDSLSHISYVSDQTAGAEGTLTVIERATIETPVFNAQELARLFLDTAVASAHEGTVHSTSYDSLTIVPVQKDAPFTESGIIQFTASGEVPIVWDIDTEALSRDLAGKHQSVLSSTSAGYTGIQKISATIRPFWKTSFPTNPADIKVTIQK